MTDMILLCLHVNIQPKLNMIPVAFFFFFFFWFNELLFVMDNWPVAVHIVKKWFLIPHF